MKTRILVSILLATLMTACSLYVTQIQNESSGLIGCPPNEIDIEETDIAGHTWTATCKGITFYCSRSNELVNCGKAL